MTEVLEVAEVPERIARRRVIVYKSRVDPDVVKLTAEKMKNKLFVKFGLSKPKPSEIRVVSVDKYYEPYILVDAEYNIDYHKKKVYTLEVDNDAEEVEILGEKFKPETADGSNGESCKVIKLEANERFSYENKAYVILDKAGRELPPDQVPTAPSEEHPRKRLKEAGKKVGKVFSLGKEIENVKAKIVKRPPDADWIDDELFRVSEHLLLYNPMYEIKFRNEKTGEEKIIKIDGITAEIIES